MTHPAPTAYTALVGCRLPLQQAGMGAVSTVALAAAVARAGGLGMIGAAGLDADTVVGQITSAHRAAGEDARIGVNFLVPFLDAAVLEVAASEAAVVECFYGEPDRGTVDRVHRAGALAAWQVGSVDEASAAEDAGCDFVIAQGIEAGGHVRGTTPLRELLHAARPRIGVPIVAAGGIASGPAVADVFAAGADAVRVGTLLVATAEADVHPAYAAALIEAGADDTVLTEAFSMGWPHAPHRVLRTCVDASRDDPAQRSPFPPTRDFAGDVRAAAMYAGTSVGAVARIEDAETVVRQLMADAAAAS